MIKLSLRYRKKDKIEEFAVLLSNDLKKQGRLDVLGPNSPPVGRLRNEYIKEILIKIPRGQSLSEARNMISAHFEKYLEQKEFSSVRMIADVDPQ